MQARVPPPCGIRRGEAVTRRRVELDEFDLIRDPDAAAVLTRFTEDRLLTRTEDTVEVAHEALLREWPRLRVWLEEDLQGHQLRQHLTHAARQWEEAGRDASEVYRGLGSRPPWTGQRRGGRTSTRWNETSSRRVGRRASATQEAAQNESPPAGPIGGDGGVPPRCPPGRLASRSEGTSARRSPTGREPDPSRPPANWPPPPSPTSRSIPSGASC